MLETIVVAVALGIGAQVVAARMKLPAILPLLILGIAAGPAGLGWFEPESLGEGLRVLIHLGVAIILFEGGLSLDPKKLREVGGAVGNLLSLGFAVTGVGATLLARGVVGMPWATAALFGAIVTVTGPTVVAPVLRHTVAPRTVKTVLLSEGLIIDAMGALAAYLVLQYIQLQGIPAGQVLSVMVKTVATGGVLGFVAGAVARRVARMRLFDGELRNLVVLALLMLCYMVSEHQAHESGIVASIVMGFTLSSVKLPDIGALKHFKGQLTMLLIAVLFILLSGQLNLSAVVNLGWRGLVVAAGLIFLVRPASVFLSVWPNQMDVKERTMLSMLAPRGIVAAVVASLAARQLNEAGLAGGELLEGLVYLTILATGAWTTVMAVTLPSWLGYKDDPSRKRAVLVGASPLAEALAEILRGTGRTTIVVDSASWRLRRFLEQGFRTVMGDARKADTYEQAGVERDSLVFAMTTNDELNLLVAELVRHEFGVRHPFVVLQNPPDDLGSESRAWVDLLAEGPVDIPGWNRALEQGEASRMDVTPDSEIELEIFRQILEEHSAGIMMVASLSEGSFDFQVTPEKLKEEQGVVLLVQDGEARTALETFLADRAARQARVEELAAQQAEIAERETAPPTQPEPSPG